MIIIFLSSLCLFVLLVYLTRILLKHHIARCTSKASMKGKVIIVTGANSGIGFYAALDIARREGSVILACRDEKRGTEARDKIIAETGNKDVVFIKLNLSSLKSVREFAEDFKKTKQKLHVLVNNAGISTLGDRLTEDGIVEEMQVNYFAPFLLTLLLLPILKESKGRIVNVSSLCHYRGEVNLEKINKVGAYSDNLTYANSKLCSVIFTKELASRLEGSGVTVNSLHPGVIKTDICRNNPINVRVTFAVWCWICNRKVEEGAQTIIYLSVADEVANISGEYFTECKPRFVLWSAHNKKLAKDLWTFSEKLVGFNDDVRLDKR